ncbi:MAG: TIGR03621 family F420-dependent LLM class oxidoreductase [Frankiaceae bacterium]
MRDFRFGFTLSFYPSQRELAETCRAAEAYGYDVAVGVDHLGPGRFAPFQALLAAALATEQLRVGTYCINAGFWNPSILAREVSTAARLTGGRLELGLGIGLIKEEFEAAGIPFLPFGQRVEWLNSTILELRELMAAEPGVEMPPLLIGGTGERALRVVAEHADIAGFAGIHQIPGRPVGTLRIATAAEAEKQVASFRAAAGERADRVELNNFVKIVEVTDDRRAAAERITQEDGPYLIDDVDDALETPFILVGTEDEIAHQLVRDRDRYGFSYISVQRPHMEVLGPIIKRVRALA